MALQEKVLIVKRSGIAKAGKGLFTKVFISRGARIVEYKGKVKTWKEITENPIFNGYVYYFDRNYVLDAKDNKAALARYANDAKGLGAANGLKNNCNYDQVGKRVYIKAMKNIEAGSEILVGYGKAYWDAIRHNQTL